MRNILHTCRFILVLTAAATLPACGGGGGGGGGGDSAPSSSASNSASLQDISTDSPYDITLLGVLGADNSAVAINETGQVTGSIRNADGSQDAFLWSSAGMKLLVENATARDINDEGTVVGWMGEGNSTQAFLHSDRLELIDFPEGPSRAYAIDRDGRVAGRYTNGMEQVFVDSGAVTLTPLPDLDGYATGMNDAGEVLIKAVSGGGLRAMLLKDGILTDLGSLGGANTQSEDIGDGGEVVGWSQSADGRYRAFLWKNGNMTDLSRPDWTYSSALAINASGQVLIKASASTENRIYLWESGQYRDLGHLGLDYAEVTDMNDRGQIVGWTTAQDGSFRAFLATPRS